MFIQPYLSFEGRCEEAIHFYQSALGAKTEMLMRFDESPEPLPPGMIPDGSGSKVMHSSFRIGDAVVMATDGNCSGQPNFQGISLSLSVNDMSEAQRLFNNLAADGRIEMPFGATFFSPGYGMVTDRLGVSWMVIVPA